MKWVIGQLYVKKLEILIIIYRKVSGPIDI